MKVKITEINRQKIDLLLDEINGKSRTHTASAQKIFELAELMEAQLEKFIIAKKDRAGATASSMSGGRISSGYKYSRIVNSFVIQRGSADWFLVSAERIDIDGNAEKSRLSLTSAQRDIAVSKFSEQFSVQPVVALAVAA